MSKGPKSWRGRTRKQRWIIIFEGPSRGEEDGGDVSVMTGMNGIDYDRRAKIYPSTSKARKALAVHPLMSDAVWLLNLENGDTEAP